MTRETWRQRVERCDHERAIQIARLVEALRAAVRDRGPGYFSARELHALYAGPPPSVACRLAQIAAPAIGARLGGGWRVEYVRPYRDRGSGIETARGGAQEGTR